MPLHPQMEALMPALAELALDPDNATPEHARQLMMARREALPPGEEVAEIRDLQIPGPDGDLAVRVYRPAGAVVPGGIVFAHGGGWVFGDLDSHDGLCRSLANRAGAVVVAVDYRLAPEHRFPAAADDVTAALEWTAAHGEELGLDPSRLAVVGDSAGGNLAAVAARRARDRGGPALALQVLVYPVCDADLTRASYEENGTDYFLTAAGMRWFWDHYVPDAAQRQHPDASPLQAEDLTGLPPAVIVTAELDPLRDEGEAYAAALSAAEVDAEAVRVDGVVHGFVSMAPLLDPATEALDRIGDALRRALSAP